jgi:hypothetical protein
LDLAGLAELLELDAQTGVTYSDQRRDGTGPLYVQACYYAICPVKNCGAREVLECMRLGA